MESGGGGGVLDRSGVGTGGRNAGDVVPAGGTAGEMGGDEADDDEEEEEGSEDATAERTLTVTGRVGMGGGGLRGGGGR